MFRIRAGSLTRKDSALPLVERSGITSHVAGAEWSSFPRRTHSGFIRGLLDPPAETGAVDEELEAPPAAGAAPLPTRSAAQRRFAAKVSRKRERRVSAGPFFTGEYELSVDEKGRLLVPADVRKELDAERDGAALIILVGQNEKHWIYPENYYRQEVAPIINDPVLDPDELNYLMLVFSTARRVVPDKQGRMVLPDDTDFDREGLGREVTLIGMRNHLQLWRREEWQEHKRTLRSRQAELAERFRDSQARRNNGTGR